MSEERNLEKLKQFLKDKYKANDKIERLFYPDNPLPLADCYLDLALVEEKILQEKKTAVSIAEPIASSIFETEQENLSDREYFLHEYERIEHIQKKVAVKAIFAECKHSKNRIYIEGAAGAGKSTLSRYIANEWANDQAPWSQYEWVFYIRLRELSIDNYPADLEELLKIVNGELFQGYGNRLKSNELNNLSQALLKQPSKVLWILDGYDELNPAIISCYWWKDLLVSPFDLLMTSRPGTQLPKSELGIILNLAVLGFSDAQVEKYIRNFFKVKYTPEAQTVDAAKCLTLIKGNPNLWSLAHTPIQLELMCSIWEDLDKKQELPLTELYRVMLERLLKRRAQKEGLDIEELSSKQLKARYANYLSYMEYLAFLGMQTKKIILPEKYINAAYNSLPADKHQQMDFYKQLKALGIVKRYNKGKQAEFVHLTFQEFFAAKYIASAIKAFSENKPHSLSHQDLLDFISKTKWNNFYEVMWCFVAGLLGGRPNKSHQTLEGYRFQNSVNNTNEILTIPKSHQHLQTLQTFFDLLLQEPREPLEVFELPLLVSCLDEAGMPNILQKEAIKLHFERWLNFFWIKEGNELKASALKKLVQILQNRPVLVLWIQHLLMQLLQDKDGAVRCLGAESVGRIGRSASEVLQTSLLLLLQDTRSDVRRLAAVAMGRIGESTVLQAGLLQLLQDANEDLCCSAMEAVGELGRSTSKALQTSLLRLFQNTSKRVRHLAAKVVGRIGASTSEALQIGLLQLLQDKESFVRRPAVEAVGLIGESVGEALQTGLLRMLEDVNEEMRSSTAAVVGRIGVSTSEALQTGLLQLLKDKEDSVRRSAAATVSRISVSASRALQTGLFPLLHDKDEFVRSSAANAVGQIGKSAIEVLQTGLLSLIQDESMHVRSSVASALGWLGELASEALQAGLLSLLQDSCSNVRRSAAQAVGRIGGMSSKALQIGLLQLLQDKDEVVRREAAVAVGRIGGMAIESLQTGLLVLLNDEDEDVCESASIAIGRISVTSNEKLQKGLLQLLQDAREDVRYLAAETMGELGESTNEALQNGLLPLFQDASISVRREAAAAVGRIGSSANEVLQISLLQLLQCKSEFGSVRCSAAEAVGRIGESAKEELKKGLLPLLKDKLVCEIAQHALAKSKSGLILLCQEIFKNRPLSIPPSHLITSSAGIVKINEKGEFDCLKVCGTHLRSIFSEMGDQAHGVLREGGNHSLTESHWMLAIIRRKTPENDESIATSSSRCPNPFSYFFKNVKGLTSHAFLILEGVKDGVRFATKIDLYAIGGSASQSSGQKIVIKITEITDFSRLQGLANNSCGMLQGISRDRKSVV